MVLLCFMTFGPIDRERSEYGAVSGPYKDYIGMYVRIFFNGGQYLGVGKVVHADGEKVLLLPSTVNMSTKKVANLVIQREKGFETIVPVLPLSPLEVLADNDEGGMQYLERLVEDFNTYEEKKEDKK